MAKSSTQRGEAREGRLKEQGFKLLRNFWVKPEHEAEVRRHAEWLASAEGGDVTVLSACDHLKEQAC